MIPTDLGLPAKFSQFRRGQEDIIIATASSDKRFNLLSIPTGGGKSLIVNAVNKAVGGRALVLTATKSLQQQYTGDFAASGMVDIRGQNNYRCIALDKGGALEEFGTPGSTCDEGPCHHSIECPLRDKGCLYYDAVRRAAKASIVVTNYSYWMTANRHADPDAIGQFDTLILDEAHTAPDQLADFCSVRLDTDEVRRLIAMPLPPVDDTSDSWVDWAKVALIKCREVWKQTKLELASPTSDRRRMIKRLRAITDLGHAVKELSIAHKWKRGEPASVDMWMPGTRVDWAAEKTRNGAAFSPVWAHAYAEPFIFRDIKRVILVSATLSRAVGKYLGIDPKSLEYREYGSTFDPARRALIYLPTTTVDRHMTEGQIRIWVNKMDAIIASRTDRKGIIHSISYERARDIVARSKYAHLMVTHSSQNAREVVERFKRSAIPLILVSPVVKEGHDFVGNMCRWQIIAKMPFVDTRSAVMQARSKSDKTYLNYLTALSIIQQTGRGMRSEDDWCETFLVDDHWAWFKHAANKQKLFPKWFIASMRESIMVPPPYAPPKTVEKIITRLHDRLRARLQAARQPRRD